MELQHIELNDLKTTALNVRKKGAKDIADLVPSIRSLGLLQPLLVRQNCEGYEIIAGQRRFYALQKLSEEQSIEPVPYRGTARLYLRKPYRHRQWAQTK